MNTHFPTVPVNEIRQHYGSMDTPVRPLVLVVDDEPLITETLAAILNASGLSALTAPDGLTALEMVSVMPPDVLITDVAMPGLNGFELAIEVARTVPDCAIILFSGQTSTSEMAAALAGSGRDVVTLIKPVHPTTLLAQVFERLNARGSTTTVPATGARMQAPAYQIFSRLSPYSRSATC